MTTGTLYSNKLLRTGMYFGSARDSRVPTTTTVSYHTCMCWAVVFSECNGSAWRLFIGDGRRFMADGRRFIADGRRFYMWWQVVKAGGRGFAAGGRCFTA